MTKRTKADLISSVETSMPDNTAGLVSVADTRVSILDSVDSMYYLYGFMDYNDAATSTTPISLLAGTEAQLTNDGAGSFTNKTYAPAGVTDIWDASTNALDFSELSLGDQLTIRIDVTLTTLSVNTSLTVGVKLGIGASDYTLNFLDQKDFKNATTHSNSIIMANLYMGDTNTFNNPAHIVATTDKDATIQVNGWYIKVN